MKIANGKTSKILIIALITLIISNVFIFFLITPGHGQSANQKNILLITKGNDTLFRQSLQIDRDSFNISIVSATSPSISIGSWIDSIIIFDSMLSNDIHL
jgi:energy-coupling factor transporter transmembrane protein EcfT